MRVLLTLVFTFCAHISLAYDTHIAEVRSLYYRAATDRNAMDKFMQATANMENTQSPVVLCYRGMAHMLRANYSYNPYCKLSCFNKGKALIEQAVSKDPMNVEIRFLRFCVQTNAPFFLGYHYTIKQDKEMILKSWGRLEDTDLKIKIKDYLLGSKYCNTGERAVFS